MEGETRATEGRVVVQRSTRQYARPGKQVDVLLGGAGPNAVTGSGSVAESPVDGTFRRMDGVGRSERRVLGSALEWQRLFDEAAMELLGELKSRKITVATIDDVLLDEENVEALAPLLLAHVFSARYPPLVQVLIDKVAVPQAANHAVPQLAFFIRRVPADYRDPVEAEMVHEGGPTWQERIREYVGSALGRLVTPNWTDVFLDLAGDHELGGSRFEIIRNLSKLRDEGVVQGDGARDRPPRVPATRWQSRTATADPGHRGCVVLGGRDVDRVHARTPTDTPRCEARR